MTPPRSPHPLAPENLLNPSPSLDLFSSIEILDYGLWLGGTFEAMSRTPKSVDFLPLHTISQMLRYGKEINAQIIPHITTRNVAWRQKNVINKEETLHGYPRGCLRNRQAGQPRINMAHPKD